MWCKQTYSYKQAKYSYSLLVKDQLNESKYLHRTHYLPLTPRCTSTGPLQPCPLLQSQKKLELPTNNLDEHCESFCRHREDTPFLWILVSLHWIKKLKKVEILPKGNPNEIVSRSTLQHLWCWLKDRRFGNGIVMEAELRAYRNSGLFRQVFQ